MASVSMTFTIGGIQQTEAGFIKTVAMILAKAQGRLYRFGELVMADSKANYVPVDLGPLRASGHVVMQGPMAVQLAYGERYALSVHENPRAGKTHGVSPSGQRYRSYARVGGWKYLELPVLKHAPQMAAYIGTDLL